MNEGEPSDYVVMDMWRAWWKTGEKKLRLNVFSEGHSISQTLGMEVHSISVI